MERGGEQIALMQLGRHALGQVLRRHEHQHALPALRLDQLAQQLGSAVGVDPVGLLQDHRVFGRHGGHVDAGGLVQQHTGERLHVGREGGGEEQVPAVAPATARSTRLSSSAKPRSSRRSASSSTSSSTPARRSALCSTRSSRRPGVATTTSAPPRSAIICGLIDTPPNTTATLGRCGRCWARLRSTSPACAASSRAGHQHQGAHAPRCQRLGPAASAAAAAGRTRRSCPNRSGPWRAGRRPRARPEWLRSGWAWVWRSRVRRRRGRGRARGPGR